MENRNNRNNSQTRKQKQGDFDNGSRLYDLYGSDELFCSKNKEELGLYGDQDNFGNYLYDNDLYGNDKEELYGAEDDFEKNKSNPALSPVKIEILDFGTLSIKKLNLILKARKLNLNEKLMIERNLSNKEIKKIIKLHKKLKTIFKYEKLYLKELRKIQKTTSTTFEEKLIIQGQIIKTILKSLAKKVEKIEFKLQKNWRFTQDIKYHSWWFKQPACSCPKMDNKERFGIDERIYSENCLIHGGKDRK